jgi:hypothetical protein
MNEFLELPQAVFNQGARVMLTGTMAVIPAFDSLVFATGAFYGQAASPDREASLKYFCHGTKAH